MYILCMISLLIFISLLYKSFVNDKIKLHSKSPYVYSLRKKDKDAQEATEKQFC